jgi:acyl carrier protein
MVKIVKLTRALINYLIMDIKEFIENFAAEFEMTEPEEFTEDTQYKNLEEWDSVMGLSIIGMVNNTYGVKVTGEEIRNASTIKDLYEIVKSRI